MYDTSGIAMVLVVGSLCHSLLGKTWYRKEVPKNFTQDDQIEETKL